MSIALHRDRRAEGVDTDNGGDSGGGIVKAIYGLEAKSHCQCEQ